ncbi:MAG: hypothetical protein ABUS57_12225 [Pseudomonadota bacterium]
MLADVEAAFVAGDTDKAERGAKAISALVRASRDVAEFEMMARSQPEDDEEELRAEIRRRVARYVAAAQGDAAAEELERLARETFGE